MSRSSNIQRRVINILHSPTSLACHQVLLVTLRQEGYTFSECISLLMANKSQNRKKTPWIGRSDGNAYLLLRYCARDCGDAIYELGPEDDVRIAEHALLERNYNELGIGEVRFDHAANVLCMTQVKSCIALI